MRIYMYTCIDSCGLRNASTQEMPLRKSVFMKLQIQGIVEGSQIKNYTHLPI